MSKTPTATRNDITEAKNDILDVLQQFMQNVDDRFNRIEDEQLKTRQEIRRIFDFLDSIAKRQEISDDERLVMGHQLDRLNRWVEDLASKIGYELKH